MGSYKTDGAPANDIHRQTHPRDGSDYVSHIFKAKQHTLQQVLIESGGNDEGALITNEGME